MTNKRTLHCRTAIAVTALMLAFASLPGRAEVPATETTPPAVSAACPQCGMIESVREVKQDGETTGLGTVAGGLLGGILGRQLGDGGSTLGMLLGMAGGAYAGNKFEQHRNKVSRYEVVVRMDDGSQRSLSYETRPVWQVGERVQFGSGGLVRVGPETLRMAQRAGTSI